MAVCQRAGERLYSASSKQNLCLSIAEVNKSSIMQLTQSISMRQDMRQLLTPRMIQSMEILQLPLLALEQRIEQELTANPVLELKEGDTDAGPVIEDRPDREREDVSEAERPLVIDGDKAAGEDFDRLDRMADYLENEEFSTNMYQGASTSSYEGERDKKLDAMNNTAARQETLGDSLLRQWAFVEAPAGVLAAGRDVINYIEEDGYLRTDLQTIRDESIGHPQMSALAAALKLIQKLEPAGVGARSLGECLMLQLDAAERDPELAVGHDFELERKLLSDHLADLERNHYPQISRKLGVSIDRVKQAVKQLARFDPYPGRQLGVSEAVPITPDATIYFDEDTGRYEIRMTRDAVPRLYISRRWRKFLKDRKGDKQTRQFLRNNVQNAKWLIDAIAQRENTLKRVIRVVVDAQEEFFEKGPTYLRPLPMIQVADQLGIHVATVSRAVSEKWVQTPQGIFPLRRFFSGGTTSADGRDMSWDAVKEKLRAIIDKEDKKKPLGDDALVELLKEQGIELARRTVAKYRKVMNIPTARQRRAY